MNYNSFENFIEKDKTEFYYLRRQIVIWEDLVKLRYRRKGRLLKNMKRYV